MAESGVNTLAQELVRGLADKKLTVATAESCTGGMIASAITDIAGASYVFHQGFVTYANDAKQKLLGVSPDTLREVGAVSEEVAAQMAFGVRKKSGANLGISATGIAGPTGGSEQKPLGLVYIGISTPDKTFVMKYNFEGGRNVVREQTVLKALQLAINALVGF